MKFSVEISSIEEIEIAAKKFVECFTEPRVFAFYGKMGAGKTTFIKAVCEELGAQDYVTSPSFAIINEYTTTKVGEIYHFDFYRIKSLEEAFDLGYEDYFYSGKYSFIEWPEKIETLLPPNVVHVTVEELESGNRVITAN
ncbi:tRNA (adenosine(37)-N6)-threonylcarbamoyltransferase complex ATPase subunit type 1 TsaE [Puteibacter caeruleilacunae]|nr:tRNA (adenosine(37)-N6)-threonylcarbamoyltransferase complex ATPase subunit type 1 TsaE [Puteibacter caeruleilacunae]